MKKFTSHTFLPLLTLLILSTSINAQEKNEPKFGISFSGYVKTDVFYDSRQTVTIREGHFLLYPDNYSYDANQKDINAKSSFNMLSIQSRIRGSITGPEAFGAKTSGVIEGDFFGNENSSFSDLNGFRLRHAFLKLNWMNTEILAGQYFHPMFVTESFPEVISFNSGAPFQPFSRNPQIRISKQFNNLKLTATALTQRDFTSIGPDYTLKNGLYESSSLSSSKYARNSGIPAFDLQASYKPDSTEHLFGAGIDYKTIVPELFTVNAGKNLRFKSEESLHSISLIAFAKLKFKPVTVKMEAVYASNAYDLLMLGGYAVKTVSDTATGTKEFVNINTGSAWFEILSNSQKVQFGLFSGITKNLGAGETITTKDFYSRGSNIDMVYRISPRVIFISGKVNIAAEIEYTTAVYGKTNSDSKGGVTSDRKPVSNIRGLLAFIYKF